jgi:hypothetical protein
MLLSYTGCCQHQACIIVQNTARSGRAKYNVISLPNLCGTPVGNQGHCMLPGHVAAGSSRTTWRTMQALSPFDTCCSCCS